jgi:serine protease inhibitor
VRWERRSGREAAAATGVVVGRKSASMINLAVDRPFLFFIRHEPTNAILFQGRVLDPTPNGLIPRPVASFTLHHAGESD